MSASFQEKDQDYTILYYTGLPMNSSHSSLGKSALNNSMTVMVYASLTVADKLFYGAL